MQLGDAVDWWLQLQAVFSQTFNGIIFILTYATKMVDLIARLFSLVTENFNEWFKTICAINTVTIAKTNCYYIDFLGTVFQFYDTENIEIMKLFVFEWPDVQFRFFLTPSLKIFTNDSKQSVLQIGWLSQNYRLFWIVFVWKLSKIILFIIQF